MSEENRSQEFRMKNRALKYIEHLLILISTVRGCIFISSSASLVGIPIGIRSSNF